MRFPNPFRALGSMCVLLYAKCRGYEVFASDPVVKVRWEKCEICRDRCPLTNQCDLCSCFLDAKIPLATERCPAKKWFRVWIKRLH